MEPPRLEVSPLGRHDCLPGGAVAGHHRGVVPVSRFVQRVAVRGLDDVRSVRGDVDVVVVAADELANRHGGAGRLHWIAPGSVEERRSTVVSFAVGRSQTLVYLDPARGAA